MNHEPDLIGSVAAGRLVGVDPSTITRWVERKWLTPAARWPHGRYGAYLFRRDDVLTAAREHARPALNKAPAGAA